MGYLAYPLTLNGATLVYQRFLSPAFAIAAITASPRLRTIEASPFAGPRVYRLAKFVAAIVPLALLLVVWPAFAEEGQNYRSVRTLVPLIEKGSAVATLTIDMSKAHGFVKSSMGMRAVTERGGRMLFSFSESPIAPVMFDRRWEWSEPIARVITNQNDFCPAYDFTRFRYVLFQTNEVQVEQIATLSMKPEAKLLEQDGEWALFESKLPIVPLETADGVAPSPCPNGTLGARLHDTSVLLHDLHARLDSERRMHDPAAAKNAAPIPSILNPETPPSSP